MRYDYAADTDLLGNGVAERPPEEQDVGLGLVGHVVDPALKKETTGIEPQKLKSLMGGCKLSNTKRARKVKIIH